MHVNRSENSKNYFSDEGKHFEEDKLDEDFLEEDEEDCVIVEGTSKRKKEYFLPNEKAVKMNGWSRKRTHKTVDDVKEFNY